MNLKRFSGGTLGLVAAGALAWGCSSKADDCNANKTCAPFDNAGASGSDGASGAGNQSGNGGASGNGNRAGNAGTSGTSGDSGAAGGPATCDGTLSPDVDTCVINDDDGVFVSPSGDDTTGTGKQAAPYATLSAALSKLGAVKRVYVCAAEYAEPGTLEIPGGVSIYGGFGCDGGTWTYDSVNNKASFKPASPIGAELNNAKGVLLQDLSITAANATSPGGSSFGITAVDSGLVLTRVKITAGNGAIGAAGVDGVNGADGADATPAQNGHGPICGGGAVPMVPTWPAASACGVLGGSGGQGYVTASGDPGTTGVPLTNITTSDVKNGGAGATVAGSDVPGTRGGDGSSGLKGAVGAAAKDSGTLSAAGYAAASGGDGTDGFPGQGGGGGGASKGNGNGGGNCTGAAGGAGGMGGCGGTRATGGHGGGASIAIFSWNSSLKLVNSDLISAGAGAGGKGGNAGEGGAGKRGGTGGDASAGVGKGGNGGDGGNGGNGGNGAGGTGGPSIALVYSIVEPDVDALSTLKPGAGGALGAGGTYGDVNTKAPDGKAGLAADKYKVP